MDCPKCGQPVEAGAVFCGNCGQQIASSDSPIASVLASSNTTPSVPAFSSLDSVATGGSVLAVPAYARDAIHVHSHVKVTLALALGIFGIVGALLYPVVGIALGIIGLILATTARGLTTKKFKITAIIVSAVALLTALGVAAYSSDHNPRLHPALAQKAATVQSSGTAVTAIRLTTPCYSLTFPGQLNIDNATGSCEMDAYNGSSLASSSNVYKVLTSTVSHITQSNFTTVAQKALESDVAENLPGFTISSEGGGMFSGSPAYYVNAANTSHGIAVEEAAVLHSSASGTSLFVLVHGTFGTTTNLSALESKWQWE
jgi:hypothetical protein